MNKTEMIAAMAETSGLSKKDCEAALTAFLTATESALKSGDKVQLVGFGSFEVKERAARIGRNPLPEPRSTSPRPRHLPSSPERLSRTQSSKLNKHPLVHK